MDRQRPTDDRRGGDAPDAVELADRASGELTTASSSLRELALRGMATGGLDADVVDAKVRVNWRFSDR